MFKMDSEKAEESEIKLPTSAGSSKKQESSQKNICFCFIDYAKAFECVDHNKLWKILKEMGIPNHVTCLQRNLYAGQEAIVRTGHGTTDWFQIQKEVCQGCILSPFLFIYMQNASCEMPGWMRHNLESRLLGEIWITSDLQTTPPFGRKWRRAKEPLDEIERGEQKSWLKTQNSENEDHGIWSHHFMANRLGKQWEQWQTLFFWSPKSPQMVITAMKLKDTCSLEEKLWPT